MNTRTYKVRKFANGKNRRGFPFINYSLTIPSQIAEQLPEDMQFSCELTDDGLLFKPVSPDQDAVVLPDWAQVNGTAKPEKKKPTRKRPTRGATKPASKTRSKPKPKPAAKESEQPQEPPQEPSDAPAEAPEEVTA